MTYTIEDIQKIVRVLKSEGWVFDCWDSRMFGWFFIPGERGYIGQRRGDPKPFNIAAISAWEIRQYIRGENGTL